MDKAAHRKAGGAVCFGFNFQLPLHYLAVAVGHAVLAHSLTPVF
jgi:hypothetical protein